MIIVGIVIILPLYVDDIDFMARSPYDFDKQLKFLKDFFSSMGITINIDKTKVMIIKSKNITYTNFVYENNLEEVTLYIYLRTGLRHKINSDYSIK